MEEVIIEETDSRDRTVVDQNDSMMITFQNTSMNPNESNEETPIQISDIDSNEFEAIENLKIQEEVNSNASNEDLKITSQKPQKCRYFESAMGCKFGDDCRFVHYRAVVDAGYSGVNKEKLDIVKDKKICITENELEYDIQRDNNIAGVTNKSENEKMIENGESSIKEEDLEKLSKQIRKLTKCRFYQKGLCRFGNDCKFLHGLKNENIISNTELEQKDVLEHSKINVKNNANDHIEITDNQEKQKDSKTPKQCQYYLKGKCIFGKKCRLLHESSGNNPSLKAEQKSKEIDTDSDDDVIIEDNDSSQNDSVPSKEKETPLGTAITGKEDNSSNMNKVNTEKIKDVKKAKSQTLCRYDKTKTGCRRETCKFLHIFTKGINEKHLKDFELLRQIEFQQLEKRLKNKFAKIDETDSTIYKITLQPMDPDWNFVVTSFDLKIEFPKSYPQTMFHVELEEGQNFPEGFTKYINMDIENWCNLTSENRKEFDLSFRPFLHWFDKNITEMFISAATKVKLLQEEERTGIHIVHHTDLASKYANDSGNDVAESDSDFELDADEYEKNGDENEDDDNDNEDEDGDDDIDDVKDEETARRNDMVLARYEDELRKIKKGTEMKFKNLKLNENIGTLELKKAEFIVECGRCKSQVDVKLREKTTYTSLCGKCNSSHELIFYPVYMHQQASVGGYIHLNGCKPVDLLTMNSVYEASCFQCSVTQNIKGLTCGDKKTTWCIHCHAKMEVMVESIRFLYLQPGIVASGPKVKLPTQRKAIIRDPSIRDGEPLPDFGICRHYKKSFRWLRFPCCGKAYPCDKCHDDKEDHLNEFANKTLCGYCAKEQNFAPGKPCIRCLSDLTKRKSSHWEGGKGCRDKITMAKGDSRKAAGMNKTVSRKKVAQTKPKEKKSQSKEK